MYLGVEGAWAGVAAVGEDTTCLVDHPRGWWLVGGAQRHKAIDAGAVKVEEEDTSKPAACRVGEQRDRGAVGSALGVFHGSCDAVQVPVNSGSRLEGAVPIGCVREASGVAEPVNTRNLRGGHMQV